MKEFVEFIAKHLVDKPDEVVVTGVEGERTTVYELRVGDGDRSLQEAGFLDPRGPRHLAVPIQRKPPGEYRVGGIVSPGKNDRDSCADGPLTDPQLPLAPDECGVSYTNAGHVGDGVIGARIAHEWDAEIPGSWLRLGRRGREDGGRRQEHEGRSAESRREQRVHDASSRPRGIWSPQHRPS